MEIKIRRKIPVPQSGRGQASGELQKEIRNDIQNLLKEVGSMSYRMIFPIR